MTPRLLFACYLSTVTSGLDQVLRLPTKMLARHARSAATPLAAPASAPAAAPAAADTMPPLPAEPGASLHSAPSASPKGTSGLLWITARDVLPSAAATRDAAAATAGAAAATTAAAAGVCGAGEGAPTLSSGRGPTPTPPSEQPPAQRWELTAQPLRMLDAGTSLLAGAVTV